MPNIYKPTGNKRGRPRNERQNEEDEARSVRGTHGGYREGAGRKEEVPKQATPGQAACFARLFNKPVGGNPTSSGKGAADTQEEIEERGSGEGVEDNLEGEEEIDDEGGEEISEQEGDVDKDCDEVGEEEISEVEERDGEEPLGVDHGEAVENVESDDDDLEFDDDDFEEGDEEEQDGCYQLQFVESCKQTVLATYNQVTGNYKCIADGKFTFYPPAPVVVTRTPDASPFCLYPVFFWCPKSLGADVICPGYVESKCS